MPQHFEDFDFPHGGFLDNLIFLRLFKLLDGHNVFVIVATTLEDDSIGSLADHPHYIILLHVLVLSL